VKLRYYIGSLQLTLFDNRSRFCVQAIIDWHACHVRRLRSTTNVVILSREWQRNMADM